MARRRNRRLKRPHLARSCTNIPSQPVLLYSSSSPLSFSLSSLDRSFPLSALFQHRSRSPYIVLCPIYRVDPTLLLSPSRVVSGSPHYSIDPTGKALCRVPFASAERRLRIALVAARLSVGEKSRPVSIRCPLQWLLIPQWPTRCFPWIGGWILIVARFSSLSFATRPQDFFIGDDEELPYVDFVLSGRFYMKKRGRRWFGMMERSNDRSIHQGRSPAKNNNSTTKGILGGFFKAVPRVRDGQRSRGILIFAWKCIEIRRRECRAQLFLRRLSSMEEERIGLH